MSQITEINRASLAQLSVAAAELWEIIDNCESEIELTELLERQLDVQNATVAKVDAIAYVADQLQVDLKTWEARLASIVALHTPNIERRRRQLEQLKNYLLRLHELGLLPERVAGKERRIDFQNNPPSIVLKVAPSHPEFPEKFKQIEYSARSKDILAAHKAGEDIGDFAEIVTRKHVRFAIKNQFNPSTSHKIMQTRTFTTIVLDSSTHTHSNRYESEPFASLVLSSTTQTISIQFSPQHVNVLEKLIAELKAIESQQQADRLAFLNRELNQLQREVQSVTSTNGNCKLPQESVEF